jgi:hypothetical protein
MRDPVLTLRCQVCQDDYAVKRCRTCEAPICAGHRWSTGREKDGYYCVDSYCAPMHRMVLSMPPGPMGVGTPASPNPSGRAWATWVLSFLRRR